METVHDSLSVWIQCLDLQIEAKATVMANGVSFHILLEMAKQDMQSLKEWSVKLNQQRKLQLRLKTCEHCSL